MPDSVNFARELFKTLRAASTAPKKVGTANGGVTYTINYAAKIVTGNFELPLVESVDLSTGGTKFEVADFLEVPASTPPVQE